MPTRLCICNTSCPKYSLIERIPHQNFQTATVLVSGRGLATYFAKKLISLIMNYPINATILVTSLFYRAFVQKYANKPRRKKKARKTKQINKVIEKEREIQKLISSINPKIT